MHQQPDSWSEILGSSTLICGIHNVTPDSFSDGGNYVDEDSGLKHLQALIGHGADIIDVGAESTRPGAKEVSTQTQIDRLDYVFDAYKQGQLDGPYFSVDTRHHDVATFALAQGFHIVNDVSSGTFDPLMIDVVTEAQALFIAMHSRGVPETMMDLCEYDDVVDDVSRELEERIEFLETAGMKRDRLMVDPGIGFAKTPSQNLEILKNIHIIKERLGLPLMVGISRKSVIGHLLNIQGSEDSLLTRDELTALICKDLADQGVDVVRVHNVYETFRTLHS